MHMCEHQTERGRDRRCVSVWQCVCLHVLTVSVDTRVQVRVGDGLPMLTEGSFPAVDERLDDFDVVIIDVDAGADASGTGLPQLWQRCIYAWFWLMPTRC